MGDFDPPPTDVWHPPPKEAGDIDVCYNVSEGIITDLKIIVAICCVVFLTLVIVHIFMRSRHPVRSAFLSLFPGVIALGCVDITSVWTGVYIPVSPLSLSVSSVLGIPGVTMLLIVCHIL